LDFVAVVAEIDHRAKEDDRCGENNSRAKQIADYDLDALVIPGSIFHRRPVKPL
jgi:hypothetical protein